jgi:hypothetical protein
MNTQKHDSSKRKFIKTMAYVPPAIVTLSAVPHYASAGSCNQGVGAPVVNDQCQPGHSGEVLNNDDQPGGGVAGAPGASN